MRISKLGTLLIALLGAAVSLGFAPQGLLDPDLSTPQKSFEAFVDILQSGNVEALPKVATPTGQVSLVALYQVEAYQDGMTQLGKELATTAPRWDEITEDIYFATANAGGHTHKMEFTKEEPGWMLYHWQIGGGSDRTEVSPVDSLGE